MAALDANSRGSIAARGMAGTPVQQVEQTCCAAIEGRRAARLLADWVRRFELSETEFQVLWCLRAASDAGLDQKTLATALAFSAAQISALIERLRSRGWTSQQSVPDDRRRHLWRLSDSGQQQLETMLDGAAILHCAQIADISERASSSKEAAA